MSDETNAAAAKAVFSAVEGLDVFSAARCVMLYSSLPGELDTSATILRWLEQGKRVFLPRVNGKLIEVVEVTARDGRLLRMRVTPPYGISEPDGEAVEPSVLDLVIVPAMAYDRSCKRLGRGGGFYDRLLCGIDATTVGVCIDGNLYDNLPVEPHDMAVDYVVTPTTIIRNSKA